MGPASPFFFAGPSGDPNVGWAVPAGRAHRFFGHGSQRSVVDPRAWSRPEARVQAV